MLLIIGGLLWFLPILGIEMLPIGLLLIAIDVPFLRGPAARMLGWIEQGVVWLIGRGRPSGRDAARLTRYIAPNLYEPCTNMP